MEKAHKDCRYFLAIDVFKGICKLDKSQIAADEAACKDFEQIAQCRYCSNYKPDGEFTGTCMDKAEAFADMIAVTCDDFKWNNFN